MVQTHRYQTMKMEDDNLDKEQFTKELSSFLDKHFGGSYENNTSLVKSTDDEQRLALFVAMSPDEYDAHGDITSAEVIEKACHNFNQHCMKANLFHRVETENAVIVESYINRSPFTLEDGREVKKGAWLQMWHFPEGNDTSDTLWNLVKSGEINGISIQARGAVEEIA